MVVLAELYRYFFYHFQWHDCNFQKVWLYIRVTGILNNLRWKLYISQKFISSPVYFKQIPFWQVYYLPVPPFYNQCILPSLFSTLPLMRSVFIRENITIVHGHSVSSATDKTLTVDMIMYLIYKEESVCLSCLSKHRTHNLHASPSDFTYNLIPTLGRFLHAFWPTFPLLISTVMLK